MKAITLSLLSGFLAATSSLFGKFSMVAEKVIHLCESVLQLFADSELVGESSKYTYSPICQNAVTVTRLGFFFAMILCNSVMWTIFTKALRHSSTTLEATVTNTAANFLFTAIYGQVFFGESLGLIWWLGTTLIIMGLYLMHQSQQKAQGTDIKSHKEKES